MAHEDQRHENHHDDHYFEVTREELFRPIRKNFISEYVFPFIGNLVDKPVTFYKEKIVDRIPRKKYYFYHHRFPRVPEIDTCRVDDRICIAEANDQFHRDRMVDSNIVRILRNRFNQCRNYYDRDYEDMERFCKTHRTDYEEAATNYFIKYGELYYWADVRDAFMKQKHRMLFEREHGPIGSKGKQDSGKDEVENTPSILRRYHGHRNLPKELRF